MSPEVEEIRYQFEFLGNYVKGLHLAATLFRRQSTDRHLCARLNAYLTSVLRNAPSPCLPAIRDLSLPPETRAALAMVPSGSPETKEAVGEVLCLFVDRDGEGFVRLFQCKRVGDPRQPSSFSRNVRPSMRERVISVCREVDRYLESQYHVPSWSDPDTGYTFEIVGSPLPEAKEALDGRSIEAAAGLAFLSLRTQVPLPTDIAATGTLEGLTLGPVRQTSSKVTTVLRERPYVTQIFVPREATAELGPVRPAQVNAVADIPAIIEVIFEGRFGQRITHHALDVRGVLNVALEEYYSDQFENAFKKFKGLLGCLPRQRRQERWVCWWRIGSIATHWGKTQLADSSFRRALSLAESLWRERRCSDEEYLNLNVSFAVFLTDLYRYRDAERALCDNAVRRSRQHYESIQEVRRLGTLGQLYLCMRRLHEAKEAFEHALGLIDPHAEPHELPREHTYLGRLYTDMADYARAETHFRKAHQANQSLDHSSPVNELFTRTYESQLFYRQGNYVRSQESATRASTIAAAVKSVYPACVARRYHGLSLLASGQMEQGRSVLRGELASPAGMMDWPSPNIRVIRDVSIIELLLHLLPAGDVPAREIRVLLRHIVSGLKKFSAARHHFQKDIGVLESALRNSPLNTGILTKRLMSLRDKVHT